MVFENEKPINDVMEALLLLLQPWQSTSCRELCDRIREQDQPYICITSCSSHYGSSQSSVWYLVTPDVVSQLKSSHYVHKVEVGDPWTYRITEHGTTVAWEYKAQKELRKTAESIRSAEELWYIYCERFKKSGRGRKAYHIQKMDAPPISHVSDKLTSIADVCELQSVFDNENERQLREIMDGIRCVGEEWFLYREQYEVYSMKRPKFSYLIGATTDCIHGSQIDRASDALRVLGVDIDALESIFGVIVETENSGDRYDRLDECILGEMGAWQRFADLLRRKLVIFVDTGIMSSPMKLQRVGEYIPTTKRRTE
jgi:hypothetical protein